MHAPVLRKTKGYGRFGNSNTEYRSKETVYTA